MLAAAPLSALVAVILFFLAAFGVGAGWSVGIIPLALAFLSLAVLLGAYFGPYRRVP